MLINSWKFQELYIKNMRNIPDAHRGSCAQVLVITLQEMFDLKEKEKQSKQKKAK